LKSHRTVLLHTQAEGPAHGARYFFSHLKMLQFHNDGRSLDDRTSTLGVRQLHPGRYVSRDETFFQNGSLGAEQTLGLKNALLNATMDLLESYPIENWQRRAVGEHNDKSWDPADHVPTPFPIEDVIVKVEFDGYRADGWITMIPEFRNQGVSENVLNRLISWGERMWPLGDWDSLRVDSNSDQ